MTNKEILETIENLETFRFKNVYTSKQIEKDKIILNKLKEQLKLSVVSNNEVAICVHPYAFLRSEEHGSAECLKCWKKLE